MTNYATKVDDNTATVTYVGTAAIGVSGSDAFWQIKKLTTSGTVLTISWADGNDWFDNVWDDRTTLSYS